MPTPTQATPEAPEPMYPAVEGFIERASPDDVSGVFQSVRQGLDGLKGPKAEQSKKVRTAIERAEELLHHLIDVREKLTAEKKGAKVRR